MARLLECGVLLRIYTLLMSGLYAVTGLVQTKTLTYAVAHADRFATWTMYALGALAVLGLIDMLVNDLLPPRFVLARALHDRHLVHMGIAACFAIQMSTCVHYSLPLAILPFYAVYAVLVPAAAFADVRKRYKKVTK